MNELVKVKNGEVQIDSRMIAKHFGKEHKNVLRDIQDEISKLEYGGLEGKLIFEPSSYISQQNKALPCYTMTEEGALQLAARYDAVARRKLIMLIKELKQQFKKLSPLEQLRLQYEVMENHEERLLNLENTMTIDYGQQQDLQTISKKRVLECLGGKESRAYKSKGLAARMFSSMWKDFKDYFEINSYKNTPKKEIAAAIDFIKGWQPNGKLQREIERSNLETNLFEEVV
ncbi:ORF6C domain-containing protein [Alkalicella caledoniensis]|uniref:ORF6C domain-containing protein n=1 Tax=Alkalicella caledoniensis TaxID=2731377 RepID=A0A7G9W8E7_ALKCA|nr:Rha family transcriptional regulator [Alkalicella caledoniensis]QNO14959.1 ORF6C domain-containing protein [Alkalicella caledoniensis]